MLDRSAPLAGKLLIVDDQPASIRLLEKMLHGAGYSSVASTQDALQVCALHAQNHYDLILLDLQMPGMDGFRVLEGLKEMAKDGDVSVLVMTAHPGHKRRALQAGAKDFISKPFNAIEVLARVYNLMELHLLHAQERKNRSRARWSRAETGVIPRPSAVASPLATPALRRR